MLAKAQQKRVFFYTFALILSKALPKRVFSLFCPYSNQSPVKRVFAGSLTKALPQRLLVLNFCPYSNQSPAKKGVFFFLFFALILTKALTQGCFSLFLPLFSPKPYQIGCFLYVVFVLTKALTKRVFCSILPFFQPNLYKKGRFLFVRPCSNQSPTKKRVLSMFALIPTIACHKWVFSLFLPLS